MNPAPPGGTLLLTEDEAAPVLGAGPDRVRFLASRGFLAAIPTDRGLKYRQDELLVLRDALNPAGLLARWIPPGTAASILGVGVTTLARAAEQGRLTVMRAAQGRRYDEREIRQVAAERERLRDPKWWPEPKS